VAGHAGSRDRPGGARGMPPGQYADARAPLGVDAIPHLEEL